jgi:hypothetical protein
MGMRVGGDVIYHGVFGTGLFQTIYRRPASLIVMMLMSIEWHLLAGFVAVLGFAFLPLLYVAAAMAITPILLSMVAAIQAPRSKHHHWLSRPLIAWLHYRQPIARGWARYSVRLKHKVMIVRHEARGYDRPQRLPFDPHDQNTLCYWSKESDRFVLLKAITREVREARWRMRLDSGWNSWDMEIYGSRYVNLQISTATEEHHGIGKLTRVRVRAKMSNFCKALLCASCILSGLLLLHMWPFSRSAVLIPLTWWAMFIVNRWRVSIPVLGLIDEVAEKSGYYPVYPKKAEAPEPAKKPRKVESENRGGNELPDGKPSIA